MEYINSAKEIIPIKHKKEHANSVQVVKFNPGEDHEFFSGSHDSTVKIWDVGTFKPKITLEGFE